MALHHLTKQPNTVAGLNGWMLRDSNGINIDAFSVFCRSLRDESAATQKRYCEVVARFLDYLYEVDVLGGPPPTRGEVNRAIDMYVQLLRTGDQITLGRRVSGKWVFDEGEEAEQERLKAVAKKLGIRPLASASWSNTIAPLNRFLRLCQARQQEDFEKAALLGGANPQLAMEAEINAKPLIEAVLGAQKFSAAEIASLRVSAALGGVIRFRGEELSRPRGLSAPKNRPAQRDLQVLDFPMVHFPALVAAANNKRDRALWLLTAASGIRRSEALNLEWHHIDFEQQLVYVLDPDNTRYSRHMSDTERSQRFKGRAVSWTYLMQPYRQLFFEALLEYRRAEYVLPRDGNDYVFQFVDSKRRGEPYWMASDAALNKSFKTAVEKAKIPGPTLSPDYVWTQHSLRHAYGMHMLNDFQVPGQLLPGLTEAEVQMLMGHKSIASTRKYARVRDDRLQAKLALHDRVLLEGQSGSLSLTHALSAVPSDAPRLIQLLLAQGGDSHGQA